MVSISFLLHFSISTSVCVWNQNEKSIKKGLKRVGFFPLWIFFSWKIDSFGVTPFLWSWGRILVSLTPCTKFLLYFLCFCGPEKSFHFAVIAASLGNVVHGKARCSGILKLPLWSRILCFPCMVLDIQSMQRIKCNSSCHWMWVAQKGWNLQHH